MRDCVEVQDYNGREVVVIREPGGPSTHLRTIMCTPEEAREIAHQILEKLRAL